jgi:hypothetical protein
VLINPSRFTQRAGCNRGFPDLMIVGPGGILYRELKTEYGKLSSMQITWRDRLASSRQDWDTWLPSDLASGRIKRELAVIETPGAAADRFALAMLGIETAAAAAVQDQATEPGELDDQAADQGDAEDSTADTKSSVVPWLLIGGAVIAAVAVIKHQ